MKRFSLIILLALVLVTVPLHLPTQAVPQIPLYVDSILLETDVPPLIYNSRVLVPLRSAGEAVNSYVEYYPEDKSIAAWNNGTKIDLKVNSKTAYINSKPVQMDTPPLIFNGRTLIPLRFFGEAFGCYVEWDSAADSVRISSPAREMEVTGFYALGDSRTSSWTNLFGTPYPQAAAGNTDKVSTLALGWYSLDKEGSLITDSSSGWRKPAGWELVMEAADRYNMKTEMVVHCTDKGGALTSLLADKNLMNLAIDSIAVEARDYDGVNLDFEGLGWNDPPETQKIVQQNFNTFVTKLAQNLGAESIELTLTLHPPNSAYKGYDYAALGQAADRIIIMAYDYGPKPEPVNLVTQAVEMALEKVPAQKLLLGITAVGETHESIKTKIGIAKQYNLKGIALWRLGLITPQMWEVLGNTVKAEKN